MNWLCFDSGDLRFTVSYLGFVCLRILFLGFCQIDEHVQREIMNHRSLKHPNIVRFKEVSNQLCQHFITDYSLMIIK